MRTRAVAILAALLLLSAQVDPRALSLYRGGIGAAKAGDLQRAKAQLARAAALAPREADGYYVHYWLGVVLSALGDKAGALKEWRESEKQGVAEKNTDLRRRLDAATHANAETLRVDAEQLGARNTRSYRQAEAQLQKARVLKAQGRAADAAKTSQQAEVLFRQAMQERRGETAALPPPPDPKATGGDPFAEIDRMFSALSPGTVVWTTPQKMSAGDTLPSELRIAARGHDAGVPQDVTGVTTTASLEHITPAMEARMAGSGGVEVKALTPDTQSVAGGPFAVWRWDVTGKSSGTLTLTVIAHLTYPDGRDIPKVVKTETRKVEVATNPLAKLSAFVGSNWQWLMSVIVIPLALYFWKGRRSTAPPPAG
jgi:hypothetical protein